MKCQKCEAKPTCEDCGEVIEEKGGGGGTGEIKDVCSCYGWDGTYLNNFPHVVSNTVGRNVGIDSTIKVSNPRLYGTQLYGTESTKT